MIPIKCKRIPDHFQNCITWEQMGVPKMSDRLGLIGEELSPKPFRACKQQKHK